MGTGGGYFLPLKSGAGKVAREGQKRGCTLSVFSSPPSLESSSR
jgi:hypothetical protein